MKQSRKAMIFFCTCKNHLELKKINIGVARKPKLFKLFYNSLFDRSDARTEQMNIIRMAHQMGLHHRWASASRKLTPASAFRHRSSQSGTGPKNAGLKRFIPVPDRLRHR
jgi:hypothetical protein